MRASLPIFRRLFDALRRRDWFGITFELLVVVLGVVLGLEASRWASAREERDYRRQMIAALDETLLDYERHGQQISRHIRAALNENAQLVSAGKQPPPPFLHMSGLDRPPTRTWDALVATGLARSIEPKLVLRLATHFSSADAFGDQYQRYNQFTEQNILPYLASPGRFYRPDGKLRPEYASHVDRLRELLATNDQITARAAELRRQLAPDH